MVPIQPFLTSGRPIILVPDGALHAINFETLPVPGPPRHYWLEDATLAVAKISVTAVTASLQAPAEAIAGNTVPVTWKGPNNPRDYITIIAKGAKEGDSNMAFEDWFIARARVSSKAHKSIKLEDKMTFFHQLSTLINAGTPLLQAIHSCSEQNQSLKLRLVLDQPHEGPGPADRFAELEAELARRRAEIEEVWAFVLNANEPSVVEAAGLERIMEIGRMSYVAPDGERRPAKLDRSAVTC